VAEQEPPRVGEIDRPRATRPLDERLADAALELRDLLANGGLRVAELAGRRAEGARPPDRLERGEMAKLDTEKSITFHDRNEL
jgi:hypothetical protein